MKKIALVVAGVAVALTAGAAFAQDATTAQQSSQQYKHRGSAKYRPLTVTSRPAHPAPAANPGDALGGALAAPFNAVGSVGGPVGTAGAIAGGAVAGATSLAFAPLGALGGAAPGISPVAAPPLPIKGRYAGTGKVFASYDEGYSQDVPVDASGPIYKIDDKAIRTVTPFTLAAFPVSGLAYGLTSPLRAAPATP